MPHVGWEIEGRRYTLEEVVQLGRQHPFLGPWPVAVLLHQVDELAARGWQYVRASDLGRCLRQRALRRDEPFFQKPDSIWMALLGRGLHRELSENLKAHFGPEEALVEARLEHPFEVEGETLTLSGQVDFYHRASGTLVDFKGTGSLYRKEETSWNYLVQQNVYAQLLRWHGESPRRAVLWYVRFEIQRGQVRSLTVEVPLWEEPEVLGLLRELGNVLVLAHRDGILPPPFAEGDEGYWQCRYCPVIESCRAWWLKGV
jgi:hypothetical protein